MSEEIRELLASYVLGDLTPEEVRQVDKLLATRPELQEEIKSLEDTLALFPLALPEVDLPDSLGDRILTSAINSKTKQKNHKQRIFFTVIGSLSATILVVLGITNYRLQQQVATNQEIIAILAEGNKDLWTLQGTQLNPTASGSLVAIPESKTILVTVNNLAPLPTGKIYRLWGIVAGEKIYCGEFNSNSDGKVLVKFPLDADMADSSGVIITIEPSDKLKYPIGETVMIGNI
jgi:anti-sigma-K factor RskA